ncbi:MAG: glycosyltransferase family 4 protein [Tetrasphaera sp.]|nr:glycosyltransferase family 4 protein [Tetrasphaera sp.]
MKIVMLLAKSTGGIGTHVDDLMRELRALGHEVVVATDRLTAESFGWDDAELVWPADRDGRGDPARPPGSDGEGATAPGPDPSATLGSRRERLLRLRGVLRSVDVVHAHGHQAGSLAALAVRSLPRGQRPALVVSLHNAVLGGARRQSLAALTARPFASTAALVTGASSDLVEQARQWGAGWTELAAVPSPLVPRLLEQEVVDLSGRRELAAPLLRDAGVPAPVGVDLILTVARIAPQKDLPTLVAAAAADRDRRRVWVVVGGGDRELAAQLGRQARELGAPVHLVGPQGDPTPWLRAASVFVLTSHWEARALVVQEALAAGTPVVTRDAGGLRDLVEDVGILLDTRDAARWADAVGELCSDSQAWHTASSAGRARAATWDDSRQTATRWVSWYARSLVMT